MDDHSTPANGQSTEAPPKAFARSIGVFSAEVLTLTELQVQLIWEDLKEASHHAAVGLAAALFGAGCALGGLPVLMFGVAEMMVHFFGWARWVTLLGLGTATLALSAALIYYGAKRIFRNVATFHRSKAELIRNLEWLKTIATRSSQS